MSYMYNKNGVFKKFFSKKNELVSENIIMKSLSKRDKLLILM